MASVVRSAVFALLRREAEDADPGGEPEAGQKEIFSSWALFILIMLMIIALFTSYLLQQKKIQAVHETVISIFAGMIVGLVIRISPGQSIQNAVSFDYQFFFNLLLPPIILASGYELHQANFFRNLGTILTFAFVGTLISAVVLGALLYLWTRISLEGLNISLVEAISVGATLSATDPVTVLAIFNTYKVDPKLYTVIFGEAILNDAIAIVLFETAQRYQGGGAPGSGLTIFSLFQGVGIFLLVFFGSLLIGVAVGIATALGLKYTLVRRYPKIESCLIVLIAYASYFFSNGAHMSGRCLPSPMREPAASVDARARTGIVTLLFCGITLKHYAYYNMSRRTQLTTKYLFQVLAQLSENFIFIYLGLSLFTETDLSFKPLFILVTVVGICVARWCAVFPLSRAINWFIRYRARRRGQEVADELPYAYQAMLFWAGLRGAVGVALAAGLSGENGYALRATVLVVVVLTVIIFGGTTARMLEILGIRTHVVEELDSDDEFDIETVGGASYYKRPSIAVGHYARPRERERLSASSRPDPRATNGAAPARGRPVYTSGSFSPPVPADHGINSRKNSNRSSSGPDPALPHTRLVSGARGDGDGDGDEDDEHVPDDDDVGSDTSDLPPAAPRRSPRRASPGPRPEPDGGGPSSSRPAGSSAGAEGGRSARAAFSQLLSGTAEDQAAWFRELDEGFIKPTLLLDQGHGGGRGRGHGARHGGGHGAG
ncbi:MAG: monovalent cation:H+ antiporter, CPA1 (nhx1) [Phylliscum demangeonii]|nr:MAG: monovalent cation:H+ antiporter, CPA1 (nhx1) [Phylliscum demangeonii]